MCVQDFSADFSDLDGVVRQRRQEMLDSSSSGSQTPDYEKMTGVYAQFTCGLHVTHTHYIQFGTDISYGVVTLNVSTRVMLYNASTCTYF